MFFGIGKSHEYTLDEIGEKFNITREGARQIKEKALKKLRKSGIKRLKSYL
jgi:RNA polymerase primary sigma factor